MLSAHWAALDTLLDRPVHIDTGSTILSGFGRGIDSEGALVVATDREVSRVFGGRVLRTP
jgi:hypothetical protein